MIMSKRRVGSSFLPSNTNGNSTMIMSSSSGNNGNNPRGFSSNPTFVVTIALLVGGLLGHIHGRFYCSSSCDSNVPLSSSSLSLLSVPTTTSTTSSSSSSTNCVEKDVDGWHAIRVFYGDTQKHLNPMLEIIRSQIQKASTTAEESAAAAVAITDATTKPAATEITTATLDDQGRMWFAQAKQDQVVWALLRQKSKGYFIDLAANDALELSNTVSLEVNAQWRGLCIEPNPMYWFNLTYFRTCHVVAAVVGKTRMDPQYFRYDAGDHGGIVGDQFDNGKRWQRKSLLQYTVPLLEVLQYHQAPRVIDYLSLDVEGAEEFIMESFPFEQYTISILTVERPKESLRNVLEQHGYKFLKRLTKWGETLWAHESVMSQLDIQVLDKFGPPPKPPKTA